MLPDRNPCGSGPFPEKPNRNRSLRINALAKELGIERPKLRNGAAIANQNTLICVLLNLRALQRVRKRKALPS